MTIVLPVLAQDADLAINLLRWIKKFGGSADHDLCVLCRQDFAWWRAKDLLAAGNNCFRTTKIVTGDDDMFAKAVELCGNETVPWLWLELSVVSFQDGWLTKIEQQKQQGGKNFLGVVYLNLSREQFTIHDSTETQRVAGALAAVKTLAASTTALLDWEQSGLLPEAQNVAESRAKVCLQCPKNEDGELSQWLVIPQAELIRQRLTRIEGMNLTTSNDSGLKFCSAMLNPCRLAVHTPIHLIHGRLKPEMKLQLDPGCWAK